MNRRAEERFQVYFPARVMRVDDPDREMECFLTDISASGLRLLANENMPSEGIIVVEAENHLVLCNIRNSQPRGSRFTIGAEKIHTLAKMELPAGASMLVKTEALIQDFRMRLRAGLETPPPVPVLDRSLEEFLAEPQIPKYVEPHTEELAEQLAVHTVEQATEQPVEQRAQQTTEQTVDETLQAIEAFDPEQTVEMPVPRPVAVHEGSVRGALVANPPALMNSEPRPLLQFRASQNVVSPYKSIEPTPTPLVEASHEETDPEETQEIRAAEPTAVHDATDREAAEPEATVADAKTQENVVTIPLPAPINAAPRFQDIEPPPDVLVEMAERESRDAASREHRKFIRTWALRIGIAAGLAMIVGEVSYYCPNRLSARMFPSAAKVEKVTANPAPVEAEKAPVTTPAVVEQTAENAVTPTVATSTVAKPVVETPAVTKPPVVAPTIPTPTVAKAAVATPTNPVPTIGKAAVAKAAVAKAAIATPTVAKPTVTPARGIRHASITVTESTWTTVFADGKLLFAKLVAPGQPEEIQFSETAMMRFGNAGAVHLTMDGKPLGPLGGNGVVRVIELSQRGFKFLRADNCAGCAPPKSGDNFDE
jgi:RodZ C-terminal domain